MRFARSFGSVRGGGMNWGFVVYYFARLRTLLQGDVQMCAMVALVAPRELRISRLRVTRFLDSYIGVLDRSLLRA